VPKTDRDIGLRLFFALRPAQWRGLVSLVDYALGVSAALLRSRRNARRRDPVDRRRSARACRSFARFALQGLARRRRSHRRRNLVVTGLYRYVRNPIYVALVAVILAKRLVRRTKRLLRTVCGVAAFHAFVVGTRAGARS